MRGKGERIRLLVVDDHRLVREGIKQLLQAESDCQVVGETDSGSEVLSLVRELRPDLVLLDHRINDLEAAAVCQLLNAEFPDVRVIVLTAYSDDQTVRSSLRAGARGFLLKNVEAFALAQTIRAVARGEMVIDSQVAERLLQAVQERENTATSQLNLSERQNEVLALMAQGLTDKEIGQRLYISASTVRFHVSRLMDQLGCTNRLEVVAKAFRAGLLL